jgi:hypothetical protein
MIFGAIILGECVFGSPSESSVDADPVFVNVIVNDRTGKVTYNWRSNVRVVYEPSYIDVVSPERSWVILSK